MTERKRKSDLALDGVVYPAHVVGQLVVGMQPGQKFRLDLSMPDALMRTRYLRAAAKKAGRTVTPAVIDGTTYLVCL